ncbi:hypothetical protein SAMN05216603_103169 [Pseudomonas benzenivorans]|nr:hypothetical protein [Pseudomonas benzenivorans]SDG72049.1 hypothetical protein SAMN05216603_103169 [Pseudomonas benzenivorans]
MKSPVLTMVIKQPKDPRARQLLYEQLTHVISLYGGSVTAMSHEDAVTLCERLAERLPDEEVEEARQEVAGMYPEREPGTLKA